MLYCPFCGQSVKTPDSQDWFDCPHCNRQIRVRLKNDGSMRLEFSPYSEAAHPNRILLVDHNPEYRESLRRLLEAEKYLIEEAETEEEAIDLLDKFLFDLVIVEPRLHDLSGMGFRNLQFLGRASRYRIPLILNVEFSSAGLARQALRNIHPVPIAIDMVRKVDGPHILLKTVNRLIQSMTTDTEVESAAPPEMSDDKKSAEPRDESKRQSKREPPAGDDEDVHFTALHAKDAGVEVWHTLLVYVHSVAALEQIRADAKLFLDKMPAPKEISAPARSTLKRGTEITIVPFCEGVTFNPGRTSIQWLEDYHRVEFRFRADRSLEGGAANGQITFYVGPLVVGELKFAMLFDGGEKHSPVPHEEHARMYRQDKIFISYSHKDTEIALAFKKVHEATGHDVLIDIDDLRPGVEWNPALMRLIDDADIFQLFWSHHSRESKYCRQEWEHALKRNREGFIRPVYWNTPMPDPPEELSKYHFEYVEL